MVWTFGLVFSYISGLNKDFSPKELVGFAFFFCQDIIFLLQIYSYFLIFLDLKIFLLLFDFFQIYQGNKTILFREHRYKKEKTKKKKGPWVNHSAGVLRRPGQWAPLSGTSVNSFQIFAFKSCHPTYNFRDIGYYNIKKNKNKNQYPRTKIGIFQNKFCFGFVLLPHLVKFYKIVMSKIN